MRDARCWRWWRSATGQRFGARRVGYSTSSARRRAGIDRHALRALSRSGSNALAEERAARQRGRKEVADKNSSGSRWSVSSWQKLEPEFGSEVAKAFRDHCVAYWRLYRPQLRSEIGADTKSTPWSVIIGLTGLAMEAADDKSWAEKVDAEEAENDKIRPVGVEPAARMVRGPFCGASGDGDGGAARRNPLGNGSAALEERGRVRPFAPSVECSRFGARVASRILGLLEQYPVADEKTLAEALAVVLRNPEPVPASFLEVIGQRISQAPSDELKSAWLAALLCLDAKRAVTALEHWVNQTEDAKTAEYRTSKVLEYVWGDSFHGVGSVHASYREAKLLLRLQADLCPCEAGRRHTA